MLNWLISRIFKLYKVLGCWIEQDRKRQIADSSSVKLNLTDPYRTVPCQYYIGLRDARSRSGSPIAVYARVQCQEPKTGQEKVQFYCEDDLLFLSSYYLSMMYSIAKMYRQRPSLMQYPYNNVISENCSHLWKRNTWL